MPGSQTLLIPLIVLFFKLEWAVRTDTIMSSDPLEKLLASYKRSPGHTPPSDSLAKLEPARDNQTSTPHPTTAAASQGYQPISRPSIYTFASVVKPLLDRTAKRKAAAVEGKTDSGEGKDVDPDDMECLPVYVRYDVPIQRKMSARKTTSVYNYHNRRKGIPREIRPGGRERLLGMSVHTLDHKLHSVCCETKQFWMYVSTELCIQARMNNISKSLKELTAWVASQLEAYDTPQGRVYRIRGAVVCRKMWMRCHGIGERTMKRALKMFGKNKSIYLQARSLSGRTVETIANGIWHIQKVGDFPEMMKWINAKWCIAIPGVGTAPGLPPTDEALRRVKKRDWSFVREMRVGEYGICNICLNLQERRDEGFATESESEQWKSDNKRHHKIHQVNRKCHVCRTHQAAVCPQWLSCFTIDMSKPVYIPSCRRITDQLKGKHVMQLNWGGSISFAGKTEYILVHGPGIKHGANENLTFLYHILRADLGPPDHGSRSFRPRDRWGLGQCGNRCADVLFPPVQSEVEVFGLH
eukprot:g65026.t1